MPKWLEHLKEKWGIKSNWDVIVIMIVFSLAGMLVVSERPLIFHLFGVKPETPFWLKTFLYLLFIFPMYQINLMIFGTLLGQFRFFWEKEKQLGRFFYRISIQKIYSIK